MAIIPQKIFFCWREIEASSDLERLSLVLEGIDDERLMQILEDKRKDRRDDYPIRAVWNSILAAIVYQHPSIESLRRELLRNGELRELCGFDPDKGAEAVPPKWVYTRSLKKLIKEQEEIDLSAPACAVRQHADRCNAQAGRCVQKRHFRASSYLFFV